MKLGEVLNKTTQFFTEKKITSARLDAELLLAKALNLKNRVDIYLKFDQPLSDVELSACRELVRRRSLHEPVAYILGHKDFYRSQFKVGPGVLIPRPETETLVEIAAAKIKSNDLRLGVDVGTGSGCIAGSLLVEFPNLKMAAIEKSKAAFEYAKTNFADLQLLDRVELLNADFNALDFPEKHFDFVVANPPYIAEGDKEVETAVHSFEPHEALYANGNGLALVQEWTKIASRILKPSGFLIFEIGYDQGQAAKQHLLDLHNFYKIEIMKDLSGKDRFLYAERAEN